MDKYLINNIKNLRALEGWSQRQLAEHANITSGAVSLIETGKREPNIVTLKAIAAAFGVTVDYLLGVDNQIDPTTYKYDEIKLIEYYKLLSPTNKEMIFRVLQSVTEKTRVMPIDQIREAIYAN